MNNIWNNTSALPVHLVQGSHNYTIDPNTSVNLLDTMTGSLYADGFVIKDFNSHDILKSDLTSPTRTWSAGGVAHVKIAAVGIGFEAAYMTVAGNEVSASRTDPGPQTLPPVLFQGMRWDSQTQLYVMGDGIDYDDPKTNRRTSQDPAEEGTNYYPIERKRKGYKSICFEVENMTITRASDWGGAFWQVILPTDAVQVTSASDDLWTNRSALPIHLVKGGTSYTIDAGDSVNLLTFLPSTWIKNWNSNDILKSDLTSPTRTWSAGGVAHVKIAAVGIGFEAAYMTVAGNEVSASRTDPGPQTLPTFMYTGQMYDAATQMYYYKARFYDSVTGRFLNQDPAGQGTNLYRYVNNDPLDETDPTGEISAFLGTNFGGFDSNSDLTSTNVGGGMPLTDESGQAIQFADTGDLRQMADAVRGNVSTGGLVLSAGLDSNVGMANFGSGGVANGTMNLNGGLSYNFNPTALPPQAGLTVYSAAGSPIPLLGSANMQPISSWDLQVFHQMTAETDQQAQGPQLRAGPEYVDSTALELGELSMRQYEKGGLTDAEQDKFEGDVILQQNNGNLAGSLWDAAASRGPLIAAAIGGYAGSEYAQGSEQWEINVQNGRNFNVQQRPNYPHNEVYVQSPDGGYNVLDSYNDQTGEIVSRKFTQFSNVLPSTGVSYINEAANKYAPGMIIADVASNRTNRPGLVGQPLRGGLYLQVPVQNGPIPQAVINAANARRVLIRDVSGRVYNP